MGANLAAPAQAPSDLLIGGRIGPYEILSFMASGGMAEIFLARATGIQDIIHKLVVIKRILPHLANEPAIVEMFLDEARLAATLQHPNVVQTHDVGFVDGRYYIAMEYLQGDNIRTISKALRRRRERLPLEHALLIVMNVCAGLHYVHEKTGPDGRPLSTVHRDVTPSNVFVTFDGGVKLLDFGIAKTSNRFTQETSAGTLKGKIPYMSPEQCRARPLDRRSDIFSLGVLLYEMSLGRPLYRAPSDFELLKQIVEESITPPSAYDPDYLPGLERIVMKALAKAPDDRYATAREMQADLEALVRDNRIPVSSITLQQFMESLFAEKREAWRQVELYHKPLQTFVHALEKQRSDDAADDNVSVRVEGDQAPQGTSRRGRLLRIAFATVLALAAWAGWELGTNWRFPRREEPSPVAQSQTVAPSRVEVAPAPDMATTAAPTATAPTATAPSDLVATLGAPSRQGPRSGARGATRSSRVRDPKRRDSAPSEEIDTSGEGTFVVASDPWCRVTIDGHDRGATPLQLKLPSGRHTVVLTNPEFQIERRLEITLKPDAVVRKSFDFAR